MPFESCGGKIGPIQLIERQESLFQVLHEQTSLTILLFRHPQSTVLRIHLQAAGKDGELTQGKFQTLGHAVHNLSLVHGLCEPKYLYYLDIDLRHRVIHIRESELATNER